MMFRRLQVKDSECMAQRQKIKELENKIALLENQYKSKLDSTIQHYERVLKEKDKLHREELKLTRGLSGTKLISDDHHKGMYLDYLNTYMCFYSVHVAR